MLAENGALADLIAAGFRVLESSCGPCIGMGQSPATDSRLAADVQSQLPGPQRHPGRPRLPVQPAGRGGVGAERASSPTRATWARRRHRRCPPSFKVDDRMIIAPPEEAEDVKVVRGPNIKPLPRGEPLPETLRATVILKVADDITTDHIMPAGSKLLPLRSNIPAIAEHVFEQVDDGFRQRAKDAGELGRRRRAATTGRGRAASTPPWRRCTWGCGPCWRNRSPASTARTW